MKNTGIQWCDDTINPTSGCDGCELWIPGKGGPCYAGNLHENRLSKTLPLLYDRSFTTIKTIPGRIAPALRCMDLTGKPRYEKPWLNGLRRKIFLGDLGDIFSADVPFEYLKSEIFDNAISKNGIRHDLLLLTKQPNRAAQFNNWLNQYYQWPDNIWIGTSITSHASLPRIKQLSSINAKHRYLSLEPLIGDPKLATADLSNIDWFIIGGESDQGHYRARPFNLDWIRETINIGQRLNKAVFVKQLGSNPTPTITLTDKHGGNWDEWPSDYRIRQMPFNCH